MKFLARLHNTKILWWILLLCTIFTFLRLPSYIEPYWYGDEGIYEVIGIAMDHGQLLYRDVWDNKPPLLYVVYALAQGDQPTVKAISILVGILSIIAFFALTQKLYNKLRLSIGLSLLFVFLLGTPILEGNIANAEDFILLPIILGGLVIYNQSLHFAKENANQKQLYNKFLLLAGLLLGIAFLFKIVAVFDFAAFLLFYVIVALPEKSIVHFLKNVFFIKINANKLSEKIHPLLLDICLLIIGFLIPLFITILYFTFNHALSDFIQSAFFDNIDYVGWKNSILGIPQGLLIFKFLLLAVALYLVFLKRKIFTKPILFVVLWFVFSFFNTFFSGRPYTHYVIVIIPSLCLFLGLLFVYKAKSLRLGALAGIFVVVSALILQFHFDITKSYLYYQNVYQFINGQKNIYDYQSFFDPNAPRDYEIATFIKTHTNTSDNVFLWGNNPQIYALAHKLPPGKYTVAYHITQNDVTLKQTANAVKQAQPKYIIVLNQSQPLPFTLPLYIMRYSVSGTIIYERNI